MFDNENDLDLQDLTNKLAALERVRTKLEDGYYGRSSFHERMLRKCQWAITETYCLIGSKRGFLADTTH